MERVLITGCSSGIGRAAAVELARRGYDVIATARKVETLHDLNVYARFALDVRDESNVRQVVDDVGDVDVLINNAGYSAWGPMEVVPLDLMQDVMDTNYFGAMRMIKAVLPSMRKRGSGCIVNVSSAGGRICGVLSGPYCASKHALEAMSEVIRMELRSFGVRVIVIEPGAIESNFSQNRLMFRETDGPYGQLIRAGEASLNAQRTTPASSEDVATVIAEAIADPDPKLRWTVGSDAEDLISRRHQMSDAQWEESVLGRLRLHAPA